jgi:protein-L-isoaspartate(D-aspartate) O-methyltransferase
MVTYNPNDRYAPQRETMLRHDLKGRDIIDARVLNAMAEIPREAFVIPQYESSSYEDNPLPIGMGQTAVYRGVNDAVFKTERLLIT